MDSNPTTTTNATDPTGPCVVSIVRPDLAASPVRRVLSEGTSAPGLGDGVDTFPNRPIDGSIAVASIATDAQVVTVWLNEDNTATLAWSSATVEGASEHPHLEEAMRRLSETILETCDAFGSDAFSI